MAGVPQTIPASGRRKDISGARLRAEFDRHVETLVRKGYPALAGLPTGEFERRLRRLRRSLQGVDVGSGDDRLPFVLVAGSGLVSPRHAMPLVELEGKTGFTDMDADDLGRFAPIDSIEVPVDAAYLLCDVDTGGVLRDVTPDDALELIHGDGRSPLTIDEAVAVITHHPDVLTTRNCFSVLGSRCGDRRVTAVWISRGRARLGWCWAGNPHTWLGSASCLRRVAPA